MEPTTKKRLSELNQTLNKTLIELETILTSEEIKSIMIYDGQSEWGESAGAIIEMFMPRYTWFHKRLIKIIARVPRKPKEPKAKKVVKIKQRANPKKPN